MPYSSDLKTPSSGIISGQDGWNEFDLTSLAHRMDGYGAVKFRIAAYPQSSFRIYEMELIEKADSRELNVAPEVLDFGAVEVTKRNIKNIEVKNIGEETLNIVSSYRQMRHAMFQ